MFFDDTNGKNNGHEEFNGAEQGDSCCSAPEQKAAAPAEEPLRDQLLRLNADFQNFKKRTEKERNDWMTSAQSGILTKILPLFDELDRVIELARQQSSTQESAWLQGLELSQKNWQKTLTDIGVEEIASSGEFNPELHEGLMQEEAPDKEAGTIIKTFSKGYTFKGKVIKHAKVSVAK